MTANVQQASDVPNPVATVDERAVKGPTLSTPSSLDLTSLRLDQDFAGHSGVKKILVTVPSRKPNRQEFFRVHPDESYRLVTAVIELKEERETYLVAGSLRSALPGEWVARELVTATNRQGVVFIWPVPLPGEDGRSNAWHESAREAARRGRERWVRMAANMSLGAYDIFEAPADLPEPTWPDEGFPTLLSIAYKDHIIDIIDHPVLRRLRGEL